MFTNTHIHRRKKNAQQANKRDNDENKYVNKVSDEHQSDWYNYL